ncbi:MAG: guanylate kinase [Nitrospirota bacterium]|nr:guanylate kinase [Nitrospirota bacterium]
MKKSKGSLFIVSAPSGAGKTTICKKIIKTMDNVKTSVSYTTRKPRHGEVEGEDYSFISEKKFRGMIQKGEFVEWAEVHGNLYGTSRKRLEKIINDGFDVILDIDTQGAQQIKKTYANGVFIFILPPSMTELRDRLEKRMSNTREDMERRMKRAGEEIRAYKIYDYVIINNLLKSSLSTFESILVAERQRSSKKDSAWIEKNIIRR